MQQIDKVNQNEVISISDEKEISISDENRDKREEENMTPLLEMNSEKQETKQQYMQRIHNFTYNENKYQVQQFWKKLDFYAFRCQLSGFNDFQMLIDLGLIHTEDEILGIYRYVPWLWKYAQKVLPLIRRKSLTVYRIIRRVLDDSVDITEPFEH